MNEGSQWARVWGSQVRPRGCQVEWMISTAPVMIVTASVFYFQLACRTSLGWPRHPVHDETLGEEDFRNKGPAAHTPRLIHVTARRTNASTTSPAAERWVGGRRKRIRRRCIWMDGWWVTVGTRNAR